MTRVFSGIKPTGPVQLGNLLGALRHWVADQDEAETIFCVVDLHALTVPQDPTELRNRTLERWFRIRFRRFVHLSSSHGRRHSPLRHRPRSGWG